MEEGTDPVAPSNVRVEAVEGGAAGGNNDEGAAPSTRGSGEPAEKCSSNEGDGGEIKGGDGEGAHQEVGSKADDSEANDGGTKVEAPVPSADAASKTDEASGTGGKKDAKQSDEASGSKGRRASGTVLRNDQECFLAGWPAPMQQRALNAHFLCPSPTYALCANVPLVNPHACDTQTIRLLLLAAARQSCLSSRSRSGRGSPASLSIWTRTSPSPSDPGRGRARPRWGC